ncbi:response regulator [Geomonas sp. RF6]|uniref:HD-GYP domain-containing protein n=1 Tax=Geomonas sp. RF6 TaxID=2897342 RepID=UPI001E35C156|nr:HD domain-containing phosphohydrolase [Geomonas sp. RF6]UFS71550.1 response regulator [Geomonas sp. RF6]
MGAEILFVDDNRLILEIAKDLFLERGVSILTACNAAEALELFQEKEIAVVVSDNHMPGMSGLEFLSALKEISPETIKVLMSAYADLATALAAINSSEVFRYLLKPWNEEEVIEVVEEGVRRYHLMNTVRREDDNVLRSLAQTIELKDPSTRGHCDRVAIYALKIAEYMRLPKEVQRQIKYGSWLHDCGKIGISEFILNGERTLTDEEFETMKMHAVWGADVAAKAELSAVARNIIQYHHEKYNGTGYPDGLSGTGIPLEARIVAVADVYDALTMDRPYRKGYPVPEAREIIRRQGGIDLDPEVVEIFLSVVDKEQIPLAKENQEEIGLVLSHERGTPHPHGGATA